MSLLHKRTGLSSQIRLMLSFRLQKDWPRRMHNHLIYVGMFSMKLRLFFYRRINREGNCVADSLAKQSLQRQTSSVACL